MYKKCHFKPKGIGTDILFSKTLPVDKKMMLFSQFQTEKKRKKKNKFVSEQTTSRQFSKQFSGDHILQSIPKKDKPIVKAVLEIMREHPSEISWNNNNEVIIDGKVLENSNIVQMFLYMLKQLPVTRSRDSPVGISSFYGKLLSLNMPKEWIRQRLPRVSRRIIQQSEKQKEFEFGEGEKEKQVEFFEKPSEASSKTGARAKRKKHASQLDIEKEKEQSDISDVYFSDTGDDKTLVWETLGKQ